MLKRQLVFGHFEE